MDIRAALLTIVRRRCIERHAFWAEAYSRLQDLDAARKNADEGPWDYTQEAYLTFPRYLVWEAILAEIERIEPETFGTTKALIAEVVSAGQRAETSMTTNPGLPAIAHAAMSEEREAFCDFVLSIPKSQMETLESLETRHVFDRDALAQVWALLKERWEATPNGYWWPLREETPPKHFIAFHTDWFGAEKVAVLREVLTDHGVDVIWQLRESGEWGCEQSVLTLDPVYTGEEGYWTAAGSEWLVYASHESSISLAGEWLIRTFRERFPDCDHFEYRGPIPTADLRGTWHF